MSVTHLIINGPHIMMLARPARITADGSVITTGRDRSIVTPVGARVDIADRHGVPVLHLHRAN
jgi:hypothetical protein